MPIISRANENTFSSSMDLAPGTYHATQLAITEDAMVGSNSIKVGISQAETLKAGIGGLLWTDSLRSCFPVIFKYKNGDIALYHGNNSSIEQDSVDALIKRPDLFEIQLFEKGTPINTNKVRAFAQNLVNYFQGHDNAPTLLIEKHQNAYHVAICQQVAQQPLVLIGPTPSSGMPSVLDLERSDEVRPYKFVSAAQKYPPTSVLIERQRSLKDRISAIRADDIELGLTVAQNTSAKDDKQEEEDDSCWSRCVIQ